MAGSALLWNNGAVLFGNADQNSLANRNGAGDALLAAEQNRQTRIQNGTSNADVFINEDVSTKKKRKPAYNAQQHLFSSKGLDEIYKTFPNIKFKGKGNELKDLKKLLKYYREWAFVLYPGMNPEDVIKKTQEFSTKISVKGYLQKLRDKRDGINCDSNINNDVDEDIDLLINNNNNNNNNNDNSNMNVDGNNNNNNNNNSNQSDNNNNNNNNNNLNQGNNPNVMQSEIDDFDMADIGNPGDDDDMELARLMYG